MIGVSLLLMAIGHRPTKKTLLFVVYIEIKMRKCAVEKYAYIEVKK
jgi:hypothetical protein